MKRLWIIVVLCMVFAIPSISFGQTSIVDWIISLTDDTSPTSDDSILVIDAPATTKTAKEVSIANLFGIYLNTITDGSLCVGNSDSQVVCNTTSLPGSSIAIDTAETVVCTDANKKLLSCTTTAVVTKYEYLPIRYAEDDATVTAPGAVTEIATTSTLFGRSFVEDADNGVVFWWNVPEDWVAGFKYRVYYAIETDAGADETVAFSVAGCSVGNTDAIACTVGTPVVLSDELTTDYDAGELIISDWSTEVTVTNLAAGEMARLLFIRDISEDDYDDASDNVIVVGIEVKYKAKVMGTSSY